MQPDAARERHVQVLEVLEILGQGGDALVGEFRRPEQVEVSEGGHLCE
jgi:hypothetical protein